MKRLFLFALFILILGGIVSLLKYIHYTPTLRIGVNAFSGGDYFQLARKASFFANAGIHVKIVEFGSLEDVQQAFEWHQINGMVCPLIDAIAIRQKSIYDNPKIILIPSYLKQEYPCQILVNDSIKSIQDLKGKNIGVEVNSYGNYVLAKALKSKGLGLQDVNMVPMDPSAAPTLLSRQYVDGVVLYPPFIENQVKDLTHCIYDTSSWSKEMQLNVLIMTQKTINDYKKQLIKFIKSWDNLLDYRKNNPVDCQKILSMHHSISFQEAERLFQKAQPLYIEEQLPLFRLNRHVLNILSEINTIVFQNDNVKQEKEQETFDSIFDAFFIKETLQ